jgi:hypothetical protein
MQIMVYMGLVQKELESSHSLAEAAEEEKTSKQEFTDYLSKSIFHLLCFS